MEDWVRAKVAALRLDASVYVDYALGLLQDEDMAVAERVASVAAIFAGAADGLVDAAALAAALDEAEMTRQVAVLLDAAQQQTQRQEELQRAEKQLRDLQLRERQRQEAAQAAEAEKRKAAERLKNMTREQIAAREQLISEYGFTVMSEFDEDGNVVKIKDKERVADDAAPANSNRQRVQQAQNAMREKMKKEHEKKVKLEKELLAKDKARKDKAKKRTMKREKQRGCG